MDDTLQRRAAGWATGLLLAAVAFIGIAHIAFLPPWEGFDETAHWSYVQELADLGHPPRYGVDGLAVDTDAYPGPLPYSGAAPFERTGRATFRSHRRAGDPPLTGGPTRYASDRTANWQAQHPPLYYRLMTPIYRAAHGLGWIDHLLALRLASFALAFAGFALGVLETARLRARASPQALWTGPIMAAWPFLFPQFFPEFARMGNDSLCLLLAAASWVLTLRFLQRQGGWACALALGAALGLGLLTKAFFLPIGASVGSLLLARWWSEGRRAGLLAQIALAGLVALAIGGGWYVGKALQTGSVTGSDEFIRLHQAGGLSAIAAGYSAPELLRGLAVVGGTFLWAGTWSLARLPELFLAAPALLLLVTGLDYARGLGRVDPKRSDPERNGSGWDDLGRDRLVAWAPLVFAAPMAAGLVYHVFVWMAGTSAVTPGWYFHILCAPLGFAVALGWRRPRLLGALAALTGLYTAAAWAFQLSLFSGCAAKLGDDKHYSLQGAGCFIDLHALSVLGRPDVGFACLAAGLSLVAAAAVVALRAYRPAVRRASAALSPI